jgi:hypothetical protein
LLCITDHPRIAAFDSESDSEVFFERSLTILVEFRVLTTYAVKAKAIIKTSINKAMPF